MMMIATTMTMIVTTTTMMMNATTTTMTVTKISVSEAGDDAFLVHAMTGDIVGGGGELSPLPAGQATDQGDQAARITALAHIFWTVVK